MIRPKTRSTFGVHHPLGLRYIFQSRVNLIESSIRDHTRRHDLADDSPSEKILVIRYASLPSQIDMAKNKPDES